ncbi:cupin domain-containing protein [Streptomyces sp. NPDC026672]|uniref:cupin domain-containing protein n=1 Tax=unclassified Streptomyces TaxID=2593676 RepID=UPI0033C3E501
MSIVEFDADSVDPRYTKRGALHVPAGEGLSVWSTGDIYTVKLLGSVTSGRLSFIEASVPSGSGSAVLPHVHEHRDESFYLTSGELEFLDGDHKFIARQGDFVHVPMGIRHSFKNVGVQTAKMVFMFSPAIPDEAFTKYSSPAIPGEPPMPLDPGQVEQLAQKAREWGDIPLPDLP